MCGIVGLVESDLTRPVPEAELQRMVRTLVHRGPEFTTFLADAGHALVLHPGDALVLPNHGLTRTAMHAVFCGAPRPTHGLSLAIRRLPHGR